MGFSDISSPPKTLKISKTKGFDLRLDGLFEANKKTQRMIEWGKHLFAP